MCNFPILNVEIWGFIPVRRKRTFCSPNPPYWLWALPSLLFPGLNRLGFEADHWHPSKAKVNNGFMACTIKTLPLP